MATYEYQPTFKLQPSATGIFRTGGRFTSPVDCIAAGTWTGTAAVSGTFALSTSNGGGATITGGGADDSGWQIQSGGHFTFAAGKKYRYYVKFQASEATQSDWTAGFATVDTSLIASVPTAFVGITKLDAATGAVFRTLPATGSVEPLFTFAEATDYEIEILVEMDSSVAQKGVVTINVNGTNYQYVCTNLPATAMACSFAFLTGEATADTCTIYACAAEGQL